jgi:Glycosyl hydrolase family 46
MHKSRRDFLYLAGRTGLIAILAGAKGVRALAVGPGHDPIATPLNAIGMPMPHNTEPASDADLVRRIKAITNVFEVGGPDPDYAYVEDLGDGRGYTVTQYGFCTYNNEVAQVIERYAQFVPDTDLKRFLVQLPPIATGRQALTGFPAAWQKEVNASEYLGIACDEEADKLYVRPALKAAASVGVTSAIGKSIFYDTWLQHGASSDPDSLSAILKRTLGATGGIGVRSEKEFLREFLVIRKAVLREPANRDTREVWRASARRVDALLHLLDNNPDLLPPIKVANGDVDVVVL